VVREAVDHALLVVHRHVFEDVARSQIEVVEAAPVVRVHHRIPELEERHGSTIHDAAQAHGSDVADDAIVVFGDPALVSGRPGRHVLPLPHAGEHRVSEHEFEQPNEVTLVRVRVQASGHEVTHRCSNPGAIILAIGAAPPGRRASCNGPGRREYGSSRKNAQPPEGPAQGPGERPSVGTGRCANDTSDHRAFGRTDSTSATKSPRPCVAATSCSEESWSARSITTAVGRRFDSETHVAPPSVEADTPASVPT